MRNASAIWITQNHYALGRREKSKCPEEHTEEVAALTKTKRQCRAIAQKAP